MKYKFSISMNYEHFKLAFTLMYINMSIGHLRLQFLRLYKPMYLTLKAICQRKRNFIFVHNFVIFEKFQWLQTQVNYDVEL